jgi:hypothetical protein
MTRVSLALISMIVLAGSALAQGPANAQLPPSQNQLEIPPVQRGQGSSAIPAPPLAPVPPPGGTLEIPLPQVFRGCWRGVVRHIDSLIQLGPPHISEWVPKTYRICYVQSAGAPFRPTISETGMLTHSRQISNTRGRLMVLSTDGRTRATMRAYLHFDEAAPGLFGFQGARGAVDEVTDMRCQIESGAMRVEGRLFAQWNGQPWAAIAWSADFRNVPQ